GDYMVNVSTETLREVDLILWLVDESLEMGPGDKYILEQIKDINTAKILVINKIDKIPRDKIQDLIDSYKEMEIFEDVIAISATMGSGVEGLMNKIKDTLPEGPQYFPEDTLTDQPERVIVSEIIREKALLYLEEEVPHGVAV